MTSDTKPFSFDVDTRKLLLSAKVTGLFAPHDVDGYFAAEEQAVMRLGCRYGQHKLLLDLREWSVQTQQVVSKFQERLQSGLLARRAAIACSSPLLRLQLNRLLAQRSDVRVFEHFEPAEAWLFETD